MTNRELDAVIAKLLGLEVLGEVPCWQDECGVWLTSYDGTGKLQIAYLRFCACDCAELESIRYFGHIAGCLEVVPFYHKDDKLARHALEQICDERKLVPRLLRTLGKKWIVTLETTWPHSGNETVRVEDESLPLAICKALGELEIE